jgi:hypothetical protein
MEKETLEAWLCGKYAPVSRRAPKSHRNITAGLPGKAVVARGDQRSIKPGFIMFLAQR